MLDIQQLRKDLPTVVAGLARRGVTFDEASFHMLEDQRKLFRIAREIRRDHTRIAGSRTGASRFDGGHREIAATLCRDGCGCGEVEVFYFSERT